MKRFASAWRDTWVNIVAQLFVTLNAWMAEAAHHRERAAARLDFKVYTAKEVSLNIFYICHLTNVYNINEEGRALKQLSPTKIRQPNSSNDSAMLNFVW